MPTGLTNDIYEGKDESLEGFVWKCAAQCFHDCREVPSIEDLEHEFGMDSYYLESLAEKKAELDKLDSMTDAQIEEDERRAAGEGRKLYEKTIQKRRELRDRYMRVRAKVEAWEQAKIHEGLKSLCLRQIDECVQHDCMDVEPAWYLPEPRPVHDVRKARREYLVESIRETEKTIAEMKERHREKIEFVRALEKSLPRPKRV